MKQHSVSDVFAAQGSAALVTAIVFCVVNLFYPALCTELLHALSELSESLSLEAFWQDFTVWFASFFSA